MPAHGLIESTSFSGHESFPLRYAWLKKGYDALADHGPAFFSTDDAMVELGVGKNMVRAIRHWGLCCGVWLEAEGTRGRDIETTELGDLLLRDDGWDPYLENAGTLWWLHWRIARNRDRATTWTWTFAVRGGVSRLTRDALVAELEDLQRGLPGRTSPRSSLKRDVDVLARTYIRDNGNRRSYEDALDSPLAELGLIRAGTEKGSLEILAADWSSLPLGIVEAALAETWHTLGASAPLPLNTLLYGPGSIGRIFRLTEPGLLRHLHDLDPAVWRFDETAGLRQLIAVGEVPKPNAALAHHYEPNALREVA